MTDPVSTPSAASAAPGPVRAKKLWTTPALARIDSSDAEQGGNPINPEGLAFGS